MELCSHPPWATTCSVSWASWLMSLHWGPLCRAGSLIVPECWTETQHLHVAVLSRWDTLLPVWPLCSASQDTIASQTSLLPLHLADRDPPGLLQRAAVNSMPLPCTPQPCSVLVGADDRGQSCSMYCGGDMVCLVHSPVFTSAFPYGLLNVADQPFSSPTSSLSHSGLLFSGSL
jgi:hypothetical protein